MALVHAGNADIYYEEHGAGHPLLLLAGLASDSQCWLGVIPQLAEHYRVIAMDNRTVGRTRGSGEGLSIEQMADDALAVLSHLGIAQAHVVGHSMGGFIALQMAAAHPKRVSGLLLAACALRLGQRNHLMFDDMAARLQTDGYTERWFRELYYWIFSPQFFLNKAMLSASLQMSLEYPYPQSVAGFGQQMEAAAGFDAEPLCARVQAPTMVLGGELDIIFPPAQCAALAGAIPHAQHKTIPGAAHALFTEQPAAFVHELVCFFATQEDA